MVGRKIAGRNMNGRKIHRIENKSLSYTFNCELWH